MSFERFMDDWAKGKRALDCGDAYYEIRQSNSSLQECEVLHRGTDAIEESSLNKEHICWLRDQENNLRCCYYIDNSFRELNFKQLDTLFGEEVRQGGLTNNQQILPNGISVPIVPVGFIKEVLNKHEQKKRRVLYAQKIKKKNLKDMNSMLWFYNMGAAPTDEECHQSIHMIPPNLFRTTKPRKRADENLTLRERTIRILETTRNKIKNHPVYSKKLDASIFENVDNVSELLKLSVEDEDGRRVNISQHLISLYNLLFPIE